jgi:hypothetical protein
MNNFTIIFEQIDLLGINTNEKKFKRIIFLTSSMPGILFAASFFSEL